MVVVIKNNTNEIKNWIKEFAPQEEWAIPADSPALMIEYANHDPLLSAIVSGDASIGDGSVFFTTIAEQINWLHGEVEVPRDAEGAELMRPKTTSPGWMQQYRCMDFETSKWDSLVSLDPFTNQQIQDCWIKFYDANNQQITEESGVSGATMTTIEWEAAWDYDIAGSLVFIDRDVNEDVRAWAVAVPDLPAAYGGSKVNICGGLNLKFLTPGNPLRFDGRTSKRLYKDATYHTNKMKIIFRHSAGFRVGVMVIFDTYKE